MKENTNNRKLPCCYLGCEMPAVFMIFDVADGCPDAFTHACAKHLGDLIGSIPPKEPTGPWEITLL